MSKKKNKKLSQQEAGLKHGFRSGLEEKINEQLRDTGIAFSYETIKFGFIQPEKRRSYTPDFILTKKNGDMMVIETKGRFTLQDRQKMEYVQAQYPNVDIRFVFTNSRDKIRKGSKTTYGKWCENLGFKYADKYIPVEWIAECE